jgi:thymidylate kinase
VRHIGTEPELVLILDAPADLLYARKGEQGVEKLDRHREAYSELARRRSNCVVLDATQPPEIVRGQAEQAIFGSLRRRWRQSYAATMAR